MDISLSNTILSHLQYEFSHTKLHITPPPNVKKKLKVIHRSQLLGIYILHTIYILLFVVQIVTHKFVSMVDTFF